MIIDEIDEDNFLERRIPDQAKLNGKLDYFESVKADQERASLIIRSDPTIFAYCFLKDKQNKPLKLYPHQDKIVNDKNRYILVVGAVQIGKTWAIGVKALHHALFVPNATVIIGSGTF